MRPLELAALRPPALVLDIALDADTPSPHDDVIDTSRVGAIWCLLRRGGVPVGTSFWDVSRDDATSLTALREAARHVATSRRGASLPDPPRDSDLTVALCTRERPTDLRRALESLRQQTDSGFRTVVVDNVAGGSAAGDVVADVALPDCTYLIEPEPGLSRARNTALAAVSSTLVAWLDDDETADRYWVERLKQGFGHPSGPAAVSGLMLPAELATDAQVRFEQYGGFNKGRGFDPEVLSVAAGTVRSPMYPLPSFGAGGNMAFRVAALRAIGGFDPYLGAGTRTHGGEETRALALILRGGGAVLHWPAAITWHYHRREHEELRKQFRGYSAGLSAFLVSMLSTAPLTSAAELLRVLPTAIAQVRPGAGNRRIGALPADFPQDLIRAGRAGFAEGAGAYLRERRAGRKA